MFVTFSLYCLNLPCVYFPYSSTEKFECLRAAFSVYILTYLYINFLFSFVSILWSNKPLLTYYLVLSTREVFVSGAN